MGEKIKNISEEIIYGAKINIELNKGQSANEEYDIHLETSHLRFNMNDKEFMKMVVAIMNAKRKLIDYKEIEG